MPIPVAALGLGALLTQVGRYLALMFVSKWFIQGAVKLLAYFGIAFATKEVLIDPVISQVQQHFGALGGQMGEWITAFGVDHALSVLLSFAMVSAASRVFMSKVANNG